MSTASPARGSLSRRLVSALARIEDGAILRLAFFAMLAGTIAVLYFDYYELVDAETTTTGPMLPVLPAFDPQNPGSEPGPDVTTDRDLLRAPAAIALVSGGTLSVVGTIDVGAAGRFAQEVEARGEYIKTVTLDSPGGSVSDALAMGALIREKGFGTRVLAGALCASSCPLILAGGKERLAAPDAAIGVHQIYAAEPASAGPIGQRATRSAMADAQATTARISRYLDTMGIAPALWMHALETPPERLYYFSPDELTDLKLVTKLVE